MNRILPCESSIAISASCPRSAAHLADGLARDDDARHPFGALRRRQLDLRQAMAVGRDRAQRRRLAGRRRMNRDAVE